MCINASSIICDIHKLRTFYRRAFTTCEIETRDFKVECHAIMTVMTNYLCFDIIDHGDRRHFRKLAFNNLINAGIYYTTVTHNDIDITCERFSLKMIPVFFGRCTDARMQ